MRGFFYRLVQSIVKPDAFSEFNFYIKSSLLDYIFCRSIVPTSELLPDRDYLIISLVITSCPSS